VSPYAGAGPELAALRLTRTVELGWTDNISIIGSAKVRDVRVVTGADWIMSIAIVFLGWQTRGAVKVAEKKRGRPLLCRTKPP
jgi:hypothetical protein